MGPFDFDPGFDELERRGWRVRFIEYHRQERDGGPYMEGRKATKRAGAALLIISQLCEELYELRAQGRGRPKRYVLSGYEWDQGIGWEVRVEGKTVAEGTADGALAAAEALSQHLQSGCPSPSDGAASCQPSSANPEGERKDELHEA